MGREQRRPVAPGAKHSNPKAPRRLRNSNLDSLDRPYSIHQLITFLKYLEQVFKSQRNF